MEIVHCAFGMSRRREDRLAVVVQHLKPLAEIGSVIFSVIWWEAEIGADTKSSSIE